ncbi:hypothetical protein L6452_26453 [Arctium lappa]|uniref:Uncharacterized protein n=1 Tax=Arctium lappa TaxID=4217 RepID=A0ACB8ZVN9_ARCLA|nr:hypothetical protein L6452_26453 [Arctium lappa]
MALTKQTLTLISIYALLFSTLYAKENSIGVKKEAVAKGANSATKQLQEMEKKIVAFKATIKTRLADPKTTGPTKKCLTQCDKNFDDAIKDAKTGIESINKGDLGKANMDISGIQTDVETCHDCFRDANTKDAEITSFGEWVQKVAGDCLKSLKS